MVGLSEYITTLVKFGKICNVNLYDNVLIIIF